MNVAKQNIAFYLPSLMEILRDSDPEWEKIDKLFSAKIEERFKEANCEVITIEATIFDIIIAVKKQNLQAIRLLDFLNRMTTELSANLNNDEKLLIGKIVKDLLLTLDMRYLNFVGEIGVLNNLIKSKTYRLEAVEAELSDSTKTIDFKLKRIGDGAFLLVEVVNIHLDSDRIEDDEEKIKKFLTHRLTKKIDSKKTKSQFYLIPVIWCASKELKIYSDYFKKHKMHIENVIEPVSYLTFIDPNDESFVLHKFANISNLF